MNKRISRAEWEKDVKNTAAELDAYAKIADGFQILSTLPENAAEAAVLRGRSRLYQNNARACGVFLEKLQGMADRFDADGFLVVECVDHD